MSAAIESRDITPQPFPIAVPELETPIEIGIPTAAEGQVFVTRPESPCYEYCPKIQKAIGKIAAETDPATIRAHVKSTNMLHESCDDQPVIKEIAIFGITIAVVVNCGGNPHAIENK